ncbi:unnamed protein product (macronuclear) [Paramecium tetraurelia]|uniref:EF-hand domain-containing protein n=1 Tax=Paramecium tetraurelia TaxID=5888 RepID=A0ED25_PARTE|nr:uncharacterized protein GSPATT00004061001 [Paramecium tetraurelia]CAK93192.1 unnamed protein product [Paramecium tetraurelia]|eukprot:XP_001460589.1 hypothetical protein (macronuclear) [Paramecium tetraurelia strain d4-2]
MDQIELLNLWKTIKGNLQKKYAKISAAFVDIDQNDSQKIELDDLKLELIQNHGIQSEEVIQQLFEYLNASKTGAITLQEFEKNWIQVDEQVQQASIQQKFQDQKSYVKVEDQVFNSSGQKSAQQFSELFKSNASGSSPRKYINIQGDFQINQFTQNYSPPKQQYNQLNYLETFIQTKKISPPKTSFLLKDKADAQQDKLRNLQKRINTLFNTKLNARNSSPKIRKDFDSYLNTLKLGKPNTQRRQPSNPQILFDYQTVYPQRNSQRDYEQRWSHNRKNNSQSSRSLDRISLQQYAYQFQDRKYANKQFKSFTNNSQKGSQPKTTFWFRL